MAPMVAMTILFHQLALALAVEFDDRLVVERVKPILDVLAEPRNFGDGDFGFFYHLGERWPRGQLSALLMVAEVGGPGSWQRIFSNPGFRARFHAPAVEGVDFPKLGISQAWNDPEAGVLHVKTYAASPSMISQPTRFRVVRVPDANVRVERDGTLHQNWTLEDGTIVIETELAEHTFKIYTGYHGATGVDTSRTRSLRSRL